MLQMLKIPEVFSTILGPKVGSNATEKKVKEDDKDKKKKDEGDGEGKEKDGEEAKTREDKKKEDEKKKKRAASGRSGPGSGRERGGSGDGDDPDGHIRYVEGYAGYLAPLILTLSKTAGRSPIIIGAALGVLLLATNVALPIYMAAHYSSLLTLIVPAQSTIKLLHAELHPAKRPRPKDAEPKLAEEDEDDDEKKDAFEDAHDVWEKRDDKRKVEEEKYKENKEAKVAAGQWLLYWMLYTGASLSRGTLVLAISSAVVYAILFQVPSLRSEVTDDNHVG